MKVIIALVLALVACVISTPVENVDAKAETIDPLFDAYKNVRILLQTRQNRNNPQELNFRDLQSVQLSNFNRHRPTRVLIHGWWETEESDINTETSAELLEFYDFNVLLIDWSKGARTITYVAAANRVRSVGNFVASYLDFLHQSGFINFSRTKIVGFSLGAHIAGFAGKNVRRGKIGSIVGLDPSGPLFSIRNPEGRLDAGDADFVEVIHTNSPKLFYSGLGIGGNIGDADFYPNGGSSQPGCWTNTCSHSRAVDLYVESIRNNGFYAKMCILREDISSRRCIIPGQWMGGDNILLNKFLKGSFYLETNRNAPFAEGPFRP